jgi:hypothetical protein
MSLIRSTYCFTLALITLALTAAGRANVAVASSYTENFNSLGTGLPVGWGVWTDSTTTGNGTPYTWTTTNVANDGGASATSYFRNVPGASQSWSTSLSSGSDRALGWRAGSAASRDGSITLTWNNTAGWTFSTLSFDLFTTSDTGATATFNLEYQIGATGTFSQLAGKSYTTQANPTAPALLSVTHISLTATDLNPINDQSGLVTLRLNNMATTGISWETVALDNFNYTATATSIPEPSSYAGLGGASVLALALCRRLRRNAV